MWNLLTIALAAPDVLGTRVTEGSLQERLAAEPVDLVLLYGGEQRGSMDTCGCPNDPRGSLGRLEAYAGAVREQGSPVVLLNPGNWLDDPVGSDNRLRADARIANAHMVDAVEAGRWDALNVGFRDLPYLGETGTFPRGSVSANARGEGLVDHVLVEAGPHTVAITGVSRWAKLYLQPDDVELLDPIDALAALVPKLRQQADVVVVLTYALGPRVKEVAAMDVDVVVEADGLRTWNKPVVVGETVWVRNREQTQTLGELRLTLEEGEVVRAWERVVDLDADLPWPGPWKRRHRKAHKAVRAEQERLFDL